MILDLALKALLRPGPYHTVTTQNAAITCICVARSVVAFDVEHITELCYGIHGCQNGQTGLVFLHR